MLKLLNNFPCKLKCFQPDWEDHIITVGPEFAEESITEKADAYIGPKREPKVKRETLPHATSAHSDL